VKPENDTDVGSFELQIAEPRVFGLLVLRGIFKGAIDVLAHLRRMQSAAPPKPALDEVMTADEVATYLGVDRSTVYESVARGEIPHKRLGRRVIFRRETISAWFKKVP
jgi:excisionase family DNA binding protein